MALLKSVVKRVAEKAVDKLLGQEISERSRNLPLKQNEYGYDDFGFHTESMRRAAVFARLLYKNYFRVEAHGLDIIPPSGAFMLVANHSGHLPYDGMMVASSLLFEAPTPRIVRSMVERFVPTLPFFSYLFGRLGQVTGTPENCRQLLRGGNAILVFPEGSRGISKPFADRYQLQKFGSGFVRLALETNVPIIPVGVVGAEEQAPAINAKRIAKLIKAPSFPIVPYPPFFPLVPLPVKYRIYFGSPISLEGDPDEDQEQLDQKIDTVKEAISSLLQHGLAERKSVFR